MIIAVPEEVRTVASGYGVPEYRTVLVWYRWWCTVCRVLAEAAASHAELALRQGDYHLARERCHEAGQLALFPL